MNEFTKKLLNDFLIASLRLFLLLLYCKLLFCKRTGFRVISSRLRFFR